MTRGRFYFSRRKSARKNRDVPFPYTKLVGAGNDFVLVDTVRHPLGLPRRQWRSVARTLCDRRQGIGADGLLVLGRSRCADVRMRIFNPDGTEPSMCGNGIRCLAWYAYRRGVTSRHLSIETKTGVKRAQVRGAHRVRVNLGVPRLLERLPRLTVGNRPFDAASGLAQGRGERAKRVEPRQRSDTVLIDTGVPHLVCWVDDVAQVDVEVVGRRLRRHRRFRPSGTNVDFVEHVDVHQRPGVAPRQIRLKMRTYERGVEGETRACGTGAVAAAAAAVQTVLLGGGQKGGCDADLSAASQKVAQAGQFEVEVRVPGGLLRVSLGARWLSRGNTNSRAVFSDAFLEGEARQVARGTVTWNGRRP